MPFHDRVGSVAVGVITSMESAGSTYALANANPVVGNTLGAAASWGSASTAFTSSLSALAGQEVAFTVAMRDAKLFSLELKCGGGD